MYTDYIFFFLKKKKFCNPTPIRKFTCVNISYVHVYYVEYIMQITKSVIKTAFVVYTFLLGEAWLTEPDMGIGYLHPL